MPHKIEPGPGGIDTVTLSNEHGSTTVDLLGATLIDWTPAGIEPVIWLSSDAIYREGKGIRGGIPICWPWFGAHPEQDDYPQHGFARSRLWDFIGAEETDAGETSALFRLPLQAEAQWPYRTSLEYRVVLGERLRVELITRNLDERPVNITQALHTYFRVGDISQITVDGLDGRSYLDKVDDFAQKHQQGAISFAGEVDRVYLDTTDVCSIDDPSMSRRIVVDKDGSRTTVVWNPWVENASAMADMPDDGYRTIVCVETTNAASDARVIEPGDEHRLIKIIAITS